MNKSKLWILLLIIPFVFACAKIDSVVKPKPNEIKPDTVEVNLPDETEAANEAFELTEKETLIVTLKDDTGFFIGEKRYTLKESGQVIKPLLEGQPNEQRKVYINAPKEMRYKTIVDFLKEVRRADVEIVDLIVKKKKNPDLGEYAAEIGVFEVQLAAQQKEDEEVIVRPNPLILVVSQTADGQIKLNNEETNFEKILKTLESVFKERENNGVFREETNEVEKTIHIRTAPEVKYEDLIKLLDRVKMSGANPIILELDENKPLILELDDEFERLRSN